MANKSLSIKDRLLIFVNETGLTNREFYRKTGFPNGFLNKVQNFGSDKLEIIRKTFPFLNIIWLLSGEGSMYVEPPAEKEPQPSAPPPSWESDIFNDNLEEFDALPVSDAEKLKLYRRVIEQKNLLLKKYQQEVFTLVKMLEYKEYITSKVS